MHLLAVRFKLIVYPFNLRLRQLRFTQRPDSNTASHMEHDLT